MKRSKLVVLLMLLSLALASFVSVPALSNENPWDADDPGSGTESDSSETGTGDDAPENTRLENNTPTSGWSGIQVWLINAYVYAYLYATGQSSLNSGDLTGKGSSKAVSRN